MFKSAPLPVAISLVLAMSVETAHGGAPVSLLLQAEGLPREFQEHFFDVPLAVRVMLDGQVLGEAMVVLSRDERVTLLDFTDTYQSAYTEQERDTWKALLQDGVGLGPCQGECGELVAAHYSLANSELALLTSTIERSRVASTYHALPENGSTGLMLQNQLNLSGGQQQDLAGRWGLEAIASLGNWTQTFQGELSQLGGDDDRLRHSVHELHTQREWQEHFLRLGYFTPGSLGLSRQPRLFGDSPDTALGLMLGSSDSLTKDGAKSAVYPIYVTANRAATVEIYRNGSLINSQQVEPGLQALDTRPLPGGIYDIDVRLMEDGSETSRTQALVYKPSNWRNPDQRWRYNVFAGRESKLLSNWDNQADGGSTLGGAVNYLLHPRAVIGLSARQVREQNQLGGSLDLGVGERSNIYGTLYQAQGRGMGMDLQARHDYGSGNLYLSHNRSWLDNRHTWETLPGGQRVRQRNPYNGNVSQSALGVYHRLGGNDSLSARLSHSEGQVQGMGMDLGYMRSAWLLGKDSSWRLSVFDRPATVSSGLERNRGVDLSLNMALGEPRQRFTASVGSRTSRDGSNDRNASLGYHQDVEAGPVKSLSAGLQADTYGVGMTGSARFEAPLGNGELMVQRSSYNNALTGNLNLNNHLVVGAGALAFTGQHVGKEAGLIIDVESDIDGLELRADDFGGIGGVLRPGRNVLPISAYRDASVQFDFQGTHAPAASIQPARARYHLNKGGVAYQQVRVMKTVTVLGRLLDEQGLPLKGHHVINHASRGVTEVDGFFSMELSASTPTLEVLRNDQVLCQFALDLNSLETEGDLLMAGDLRCVDGATTGQLARS